MPSTNKALDAIVGKTIAKVEVCTASNEFSITIHFTDETSIAIQNDSLPSFDLFYAYGPADEEVIRGQLKGRR